MAGSVNSLLDLIEASQSQKEVTANALFDAASPAMLYARRARTSAGLTWGYYGGALLIGGSIVSIPNGTLTLAPSIGNWIEADPATGAVSLNNTGFTAGRIPLYLVLTTTNSIVDYDDLRSAYSAASAAAGDSLAAHIAASDPHPQYQKESEKGAANGYAGLGSDGKVPSSQLPAPATTGGTVTSVALTTPGLLFDVTGSPVTGTGTLAMTLKTQAKNTFLAGPATGADAVPTMRALTQADLPAQPFDVTAFYPGVPPGTALVTRVPVARAVTFPSDLTGSIGKASVAATASTVFSIQKNGSSVGSITFGAGATFATFSAASAITLAAGDVLSIVAPATPDATLANIGIVLAGVR